MTIQEIQEQLKAQGFEVSEEAIAAKLQSLKIKPEDITDEIQEIAIQDLVQAFTDEQNERAIVPKKRTQKQALTEIRGWFTQCGLSYTEAQLKVSLQKEGIDPLEVTIEWVRNWAEQLKSKSLTTTESAAPATQQSTQPPAQQEIPVDVPFANLDQVLGGIENVGVQIVLQTNDHINHVVEKVVNFAQAGPTLAAQRINQRMGLVGLENPVESILQANRELCANSLSRIDEAIARAS